MKKQVDNSIWRLRLNLPIECREIINKAQAQILIKENKKLNKDAVLERAIKQFKIK